MDQIRRALLLEQRMSVEECQQIFQLFNLAKTILDHALSIQSHYPFRMVYVMVEVDELAKRLKEITETVEQALHLLRGMGRANIYGQNGRWRLELPETAKPLGRGSSAGQ